jgi:hypothetical protein
MRRARVARVGRNPVWLELVGVADDVDDVGHHAGEVVVLRGVDGSDPGGEQGLGGGEEAQPAAEFP